MDRTERLLDLVALLLDAPEPVPFSDLREAFPDDYGGARESAERKLERDKAELLQLGVPLEFVPPSLEDGRDTGGYRIDRAAFFLPDPRLAPEEAAALYAAGSAALAARDFPFAQDLQHALRKISLAGAAPAPQSVSRSLLVVRPGDTERAPRLRDLAGAVARRKRVHLRYDKFGAITERDVDPYGLAFRGGTWRLVGYCHLRKAQRVFLVDRIERLEVNEQKPSQADFQIPEGFDAGEAAGRRPWQWTGAAPMEVTLRFAPGSELLAERAFDAPAGDTARLRVTHLDGLLTQVLAQGDRVWVEGPAQASTRARRALMVLLDQHSGASSPVEGAAAPEPVKATQPAGKRASKQLEPQERLRRLLLIVPAARRRPGIRVEELARELGLAPDELMEDIDLLGFVGRPPFSPDDLIDISVDERGRVTVMLDQSFSRPPQLTALEALALAAAAQETAPADPAVVAALRKLTDELPAKARNLYAALARRVAAATPPPRGTDELLARLRRAADERREVALDYDKEGRGDAGPRTVHPRAVVEHRGRWYVYAYDPARSADRTFRLDRVRGVRETGVTFPDPGPVDPALFQRAALFFPTGAERPVTVRFSPAAAGWALSRYGDRARRLAGGGVEAAIDTAGTQYAVSLVLSFAGAAEIVDPPEARSAVRAEAERALSRY
ncbi:MAG: helix-turn-helix transcriptional regulator [Myxococcales bacterium]